MIIDIQKTKFDKINSVNMTILGQVAKFNSMYRFIL